MWGVKRKLQAQERELLQQLKQHQDLKSSLRAQLLERLQQLLQLGSSISRRTCSCPVQVSSSHKIFNRFSVFISRLA
jgi:hypothetical protein